MVGASNQGDVTLLLTCQGGNNPLFVLYQYEQTNGFLGVFGGVQLYTQYAPHANPGKHLTS